MTVSAVMTPKLRLMLAMMTRVTLTLAREIRINNQETGSNKLDTIDIWDDRYYRLDFTK